MMRIQDPVFHDEEGYYFWDETYSKKLGPYETKQEAINACIKYMHRQEA